MMKLKQRAAAAMIFLLLCMAFILPAAAVDLRGVMESGIYPEIVETDDETLQYRLYVPDTVTKYTESVGEGEDGTSHTVTTYHSTSGETYGLLLWLHDEDLRGDDNTAHIADDAKNGLLNAFLNHAERAKQFIIVAPQCPAGKTWADMLPLVTAWVKDFQSQNHLLDEDRMFVAGISMGAAAGYTLIEDPDFSVTAAFLVGGTCAAEVDAAAYQGTTVYAFISETDDAYSAAPVLAAAETVNQAGGSFLLANYADIGHEIWGQAFSDEALVAQFMNINAPAPADVTEPVVTEPVDTASETESLPVETQPVETAAPETTAAPEEPAAPSIAGIEITAEMIAYVIMAAACLLAVIWLFAGLAKHNRSR